MKGMAGSMLMSVRSQPNAHKTHRDARPQRCNFRELKKNLFKILLCYEFLSDDEFIV